MLPILQDIISWKLRAYQHRLSDQEQVLQLTQLSLNSYFNLLVYICISISLSSPLQSPTELVSLFERLTWNCGITPDEG